MKITMQVFWRYVTGNAFSRLDLALLYEDR